MKRLPVEILSMVFDHLEDTRDFKTLLTLGLTGKFLGQKALRSLYRIHEYSRIFRQPDPFKEYFDEGFGIDFDEDFDLLFDDIHHLKIINFWESIILSSLGETIFPYCLFIRSLNLNSLESKICPQTPWSYGALNSLYVRNMFDEITRYMCEEHSVIHRQEIVESVVDCIFRFTCKESGARVNLESLSWHPKKTIPERWISHISNLRTLGTSDRLSLELGKLISQSCPRFHTLHSSTTYYTSAYIKAPSEITLFLNQLRQNTLRNLSICPMPAGNEIIRSLNRQAESLKELRLESIILIATKNLHRLNAYKTLTSLRLNFRKWNTEDISEFRERKNGLFQAMVDWICSCRSLRKLFLVQLPGGIAIAIVTQVCRKDWIRLQTLYIHSLIQIEEREDFLRALSTQTMLEYLIFDVEVSLQSYCHLGDDPNFASLLGRLVNLKCLSLQPNSKYRNLPVDSAAPYDENSIIDLVSYLPKLEEFTFQCRCATDAIWSALAKLKYLNYLNILARPCFFSFNGILEFVDALASTNKGLRIFIETPSIYLSDEQTTEISLLLSRRVDGDISTRYGISRYIVEYHE
ncbi:hypothetical protein K3495_g11406 [Podosphaera aphanis]|nr:hypothetical protein K3495_g11406 [Podosphaera aphanis]